jgi:hypothetical protein
MRKARRLSGARTMSTKAIIRRIPASLERSFVTLDSSKVEFIFDVTPLRRFQATAYFADGAAPTVKNAALFQFGFFDEAGAEVPHEFPAALTSQKIGPYSYLWPVHVAQGLPFARVSFRAPQGAAYARIVARNWSSRSDVRILNRIEISEVVEHAERRVSPQPPQEVSAPLLSESLLKVRHRPRLLSIVDEISELNWGSELALVPADRQHAGEQLKHCEALFLESAWNANSGQWQYAFTSPGLKHANAVGLTQLIDAATQLKRPVIFWNKEDPMHYDRFLPIAQKCSHIFTTDSNRISSYERDCGSAEVIGCIPFAAEPRISNPSDRFRAAQETICFAGTYYTEGHDERNRQLEYLLPLIPALSGAIYDRYSKLQNARYAFPGEYASYIRDSLSFAEMNKKYKSFKLFLNVNTIVDSPTMMSRRVYELLASGTPVISAPSRAIEVQFDGVVHVASTTSEAMHHAERLLGDADYWERSAHRGYRTVMAEHTYAHRADTILAGLGGRSDNRGAELVSVVLASCRAFNLPRMMENLGRQNYTNIEVIFALTPDFSESDLVALSRLPDINPNIKRVIVEVLPSDVPLGKCLNVAIRKSSGSYIAKMDDDNIYFEHFISDLMYPFGFGDYDIVGKESHYCYLGGMNKMVLRAAQKRHQETQFVAGDAMIIRRRVFERVSFPEFRVGEDSKFLRDALSVGCRIYSADRFSFVKYRAADLSLHTWKAEEEELLRQSTIVASGPQFDIARLV